MINEDLKKQVKIISIQTSLKSETVLDLLRSGWMLHRVVDEPTTWVQGNPWKYELKKES